MKQPGNCFMPDVISTDKHFQIPSSSSQFMCLLSLFLLLSAILDITTNPVHKLIWTQTGAMRNESIHFPWSNSDP